MTDISAIGPKEFNIYSQVSITGAVINIIVFEKRNASDVSWHKFVNCSTVVANKINYVG